MNDRHCVKPNMCKDAIEALSKYITSSRFRYVENKLLEWDIYWMLDSHSFRAMVQLAHDTCKLRSSFDYVIGRYIYNMSRETRSAVKEVNAARAMIELMNRGLTPTDIAEKMIESKHER